MTSIQNDDDFIDEDDIEIVSLLDRQDDNRHNEDKIDDQNNTSTIHQSVDQRSHNKRENGHPRSQLIGVCATIGLVLFLATILLSRSSTVPGTQTPTATTKEDYIDTKNEGNNQSIPSSPTLPPTITKETEDSHNEDPGDDEIEWFELRTGNSRIDQAYRLAMDELHQNIEYDANGTPYFVTGAGGDRAWTRTMAYAIELGVGLVQPDVSRLSLESCTEWTVLSTENKQFNASVWYQDTSDTFGGWPNLSDAIVGARGAWNLYLYTGDSTLLEWAYEISLRSLLRAEQEALQNKPGTYFEKGLFGGAASLLDPDPAYPAKYKQNAELVGKTKALSTNILYYNGYRYTYQMGKILMENNQIVNSLKDRSNLLKKTIRKRLWMEKNGAYGYFEDEGGNLFQLMEGLGMVLTMLSEDFESEHRIKMMFDSLHRTKVGIPSLGSGNTDDMNDVIYDLFHSGRVWPFLSGLFAIAAAKYGYSDIFAEEMANLIDLSEQGNTFAEFYELDKSFDKEQGRQLWSGAGYLGTVYKGLLGMDFQTGGIAFSPNKIEGKDGVLKMNETISLLNVKYRRAVLDIHVTGSGTNVTSFKLNGEVRKVAQMDGWVTGRQLIEIEVAPSKSSVAKR